MSVSRSKKALYSVIAGIVYEIVELVCGLILPRLILSAFGSAYNGITSSITQFISVISLMKAGIGGVTRAALYKPLAEGNTDELSAIVNQTQSFLRKVALLFMAFILVFAAIYPIFVCDDFDWLFTFTLIVIISFAKFAQYYFGLAAQMVLAADQKQYISVIFGIISVVLNTTVSVVLIKLGATIHVVKLGSSVVYFLSPVLANYYVKKKYNINSKVRPEKDYVKQRWDAVGHEVANFINSNTDVMVLTVLSTLENVSVYTVYNYVILCLRKILNTFVTGLGAAFGNMFALKQYKLMEENMRLYEMIVFSFSSIVYSTALVMITPFVAIYTHGVTDADYHQPLFGIILTFAAVIACFRTPYETVVKALGHYKQTRNQAFVEAGINIAVSVVCVFKFGLVGVAVGTLCAMLYRTVVYATYLSKNLIQRSIFCFIKHAVITLSINAVTLLLSRLYMPSEFSIIGWITYATITTLISVALTVVTDFVFYKEDFLMTLRKMIAMLKRKKSKKNA
ncbi:MAG: polysaccharide biosynthesis C-terminal domain-containing protein [Clostridia bacterium]|nr:polysaccharide biosynthesis C-terminal domain-containing protein [Clostridia bacterium]